MAHDQQTVESGRRRSGAEGKDAERGEDAESDERDGVEETGEGAKQPESRGLFW